MTGANEEKLDELLAITGGSQLEKESQAFRPLKNPVKQKQEITKVLLLISFLLLFIEIAIRRFGLPVKLVAVFEKRESVKKQRARMATKEKKRIAPKETPVAKKKDVQPDSSSETNEKQAKPLKRTKAVNEKIESDNHLDQLLEMKRKKKR